MIITVLIEDKEHKTLKYEHGLSFYITHKDKNYLLDTGSSPKCIHNAKELNISLDNLDVCFLSHGHYDHSGGFKTLFDMYPGIRTYAMENALDKRYSTSRDHFHEVGVQEELYEYRDNFISVNKYLQINKDIYIIPHNKSYAHIGRQVGMYKNKEEYDDFSHEMSVVFDTDKGLVIFNSCSHAGLKNITEEVLEVINKPVFAYIGGLHLKGKKDGKEICTLDDHEIKDLCTYIIDKDIKHIYTGHCTGNVGYSKLEYYLRDRIYPLYTGLKIEI